MSVLHCRKQICHLFWFVQFDWSFVFTPVQTDASVHFWVQFSNTWKNHTWNFYICKSLLYLEKFFLQRTTFSPSICILLPICQFTVQVSVSNFQSVNLQSKYLYLTSNLSTYSPSICIFLPIFQFTVALDLYSKYLYLISNLSTYNGLSAYVSTLSFPAENFPRRCKQPFWYLHIHISSFSLSWFLWWW